MIDSAQVELIGSKPGELLVAKASGEGDHQADLVHLHLMLPGGCCEDQRGIFADDGMALLLPHKSIGP